jgi:hypothetical protein
MNRELAKCEEFRRKKLGARRRVAIVAEDMSPQLNKRRY